MNPGDATGAAAASTDSGCLSGDDAFGSADPSFESDDSNDDPTEPGGARVGRGGNWHGERERDRPLGGTVADEGVWQGGQPNKQSRSWRRRSSALRGLRSAWQCPQAYLGAWGSELGSLRPARVPTAAVAPVLEPAMAPFVPPTALTALSTALVALGSSSKDVRARGGKEGHS